MFHSLIESISLVKSIDPIVATDDTEGTGTAVDLAGYESAVVIFEFGISGDTLSGSVNVLPLVQESDDGATGWTAVAAAQIDGALLLIDDAAEDPATQVVGLRETKRYVRAFVGFTGTHTNGMPIAASVIRGRPRHAGAQAV